MGVATGVATGIGVAVATGVGVGEVDGVGVGSATTFNSKVPRRSVKPVAGPVPIWNGLVQ